MTKKSSKAITELTAVSELKGVGPQMAAKLERLHVHTVQDVLFHLPMRYEDKTSVTEIGALLPNLSTVIIGQVELAQVVFGRRRSLLVRISDGTGSLTIRMFYFSNAQQKAFRRGSWVRCFGEARRGAKSRRSGLLSNENQCFSSFEEALAA